MLCNHFANINVVFAACRIAPIPRGSRLKNPGTAAVLSAIIPGVGQFYNGTFWRAIFWLIITPGLWIGSGGFLGWICHVISAYTAYNYARTHRTEVV